MRRLVVDLDVVAALRELAGGREPRLPRVAVLAELAGADAVRVTVARTLEPVAEHDLHDLRRVVSHLELCMAPAPSLLKLALEVRPDRVVLAAEAKSDRLGAPPLPASVLHDRTEAPRRALTEAAIDTSVRVVPELASVKALRGVALGGVEFSTVAISELSGSERERAYTELVDASHLGAKLRMPVSLAGMLTPRSVIDLLREVPVAETVVAGRCLFGRAQLVGIERAVGEMRAALG